MNASIDFISTTIGDIADVISGPFGSQLHESDYKEYGTPIVTVEHLSPYGLTTQNLPFVGDEDKERLNRYTLKQGDIVFSRVGSVDRCSLVREEEEGWLFSGRLLRIRLNNSDKEMATLLSYIFQTNRFTHQVRSKAVGQTMPSLNNGIVKSLQISIPRNPQIQKIYCDTLINVDQKINLLTKKKEALETYKKGLMQKIFSQELRFKREDGTDYPEWESYKLKEVLIEHKKRSDGSEQVHSVSVHKGVVNQIEHLGRSFAAKDVSNYNKVLFGDVIYTKSPTGDFPYGIIKQSHVHNAIVSPLYCVTSPIDINIGYLLNWFFESNINVHNYLHPIIQKGAKNTINITNSTFLSRSLFLPSDKAERQKIKDVYSSLNDNLRTLESEISKVTEFKKGLLQLMFV